MLFIFLIIIILLLFFLIVLIYKNSLLINVVNNYEKIINDQAMMNHEYNNQLLVITAYLDDKKKLKEYLNTIINDHKAGKSFEIRQLSNLPNGGVKKLLYYKICKMKKLKIKCFIYITAEIKEILKKFNITDYSDLTKILGVLLDNAIDGTKKASNKEIFIDIKKDEGYLNISITNTVEDISIVKNMGKRKFSTKGKGHGYGLMLVKNIIKRNRKYELVTNFNDKEIIQTVLYDLK